ncbi:MAG: GNAT family N-acetyltransferase [Candidatus Accumulibacter sp.]|nr:GNAT family N-acetyltransferase [Accumulibacter sp.]
MSAWNHVPLARSLGSWAEAWDALNRELNDAHPLLDSRFVDALLKYFAGGDEVLCVHRSADRIDGLCILCPKGRGAWTTFLPAQAQIAPLLLKDGATLGALFAGGLPGWASMVDFMCQDPAFSALANLDGIPATAMDHALTINIDIAGEAGEAGGFDAYWAQRSKNLTHNIRRYANRLEKDGVRRRLVRLAEAAQMRDAVARYGELESSGWKGREGTAIHIDNAQGRFYREVLERFAASGQAAVYESWFDDRLAASRLVIVSPAMTVILKTAYDESLSGFAPGRLQLFDLIGQTFAEGGRRTIEFYTNATSDQLAWATGQRTIRHVTVFRNAGVRLAYETGRRLLRRLRTR